MQMLTIERRDFGILPPVIGPCITNAIDKRQARGSR